MTPPAASMVTFAFAFLAFAGTALAQTPAAPAPPAPPPPPQEGSAEFSFVGTSGNATTSALGLGGEFIVRRTDWTLRSRANYVRNESESELKAEAVKATFRGSWVITPRIAAFSEYGFLRDQFAGIDARNTVDGGFTFAIVRPQPHQFDVDAGIGYANENRVTADDLSTAQALAGARYKFTLSETAEITDDLIFTASLSDGDDWRTGNTVALTVKIATIFSLKVSNVARYVNAPVNNFQTTDTLTSVALVAKF
jgi:putative salt-induced outer membrane protein YdiY